MSNAAERLGAVANERLSRRIKGLISESNAHCCTGGVKWVNDGILLFLLFLLMHFRLEFR